MARRAAPVCGVLFGVDSRYEAAVAAGSENAAGLRHGKRAAIAINIANSARPALATVGIQRLTS